MKILLLTLAALLALSVASWAFKGFPVEPENLGCGTDLECCQQYNDCQNGEF